MVSNLAKDLLIVLTLLTMLTILTVSRLLRQSETIILIDSDPIWKVWVSWPGSKKPLWNIGMHFLSEKIRIFHFSGLHVSTAYQNFCSLYFSGINTLFIISIISIILIFFLHHQFDLYHHLYIHRNQAHILSKLVSGLVIAIRQSTRWSTACFQGPPHDIFIIFRNIFKVLLIIFS